MDALSQNPSHFPDVGLDVEFNTHTVIPDEAVMPFIAETVVSLATILVTENTELDLYFKAKFLQALSKGYERLLELACEDPVGQTQGYHKIDSVLYHQGQLWVPEGTIQDKIMEAHHNSPTAGHPGKNKTIELI